MAITKFNHNKFPQNKLKLIFDIVIDIQKSGFLLFCFFSERFRLFWILFLITDFGTLVAFRSFGISNPCFIICRNLLITISLFLSCLLSSSQFRIKIWSLVSRGANFSSNSIISSSDNAFEFFKSKDSTTFDETLFTFCPPAPLLRTALKLNSDMIFSTSKIIVADG